jgi:ligand-binding SRPBCC domain-containing protein
MKYILYREQQLKCDIDTAWKFFCNPRNLSRITPKNLDFTVLTTANESIYEGMEIYYKVSPLFGIPLKWKTRITHVEYFKCFTDDQEEGPYNLWSHHHRFIPNNNGVLMTDKVDYILPFGLLGRIAHILLVKHKLNKIFDYRFQVLEELFTK